MLRMRSVMVKYVMMAEIKTQEAERQKWLGMRVPAPARLLVQPHIAKARKARPGAHPCRYSKQVVPADRGCIRQRDRRAALLGPLCLDGPAIVAARVAARATIGCRVVEIVPSWHGLHSAAHVLCVKTLWRRVCAGTRHLCQPLAT